MKFLSALAGIILAATQVPAFAQMVQPTRFGLLAADSDNILQFEGARFDKEVLLAQPDYVFMRFELKDADVIFLRQNKGEDCPQKFAIVRVTADGATGMPELGTCDSTRIRPEREGQVIRFSQKQKDSATVIRYEYADGELKELESSGE